MILKIFRNLDLIDHDIEPIFQQPIFQCLQLTTIEAIKIIAVKIFLGLMANQFLLIDQSKKKYANIYVNIVLAPVVEEILFRGLLLNGIYFIQKISCDDSHQEQTQEQSTTQRIYRVHLSALIFASAHLMNPHKTTTGALIQFTWSYSGGVAYGYLYEKYHTLSVSIFAHGCNNSLVSAMVIYPKCAIYFFIAVLVNKVGAYLLAVTTIDEKLLQGLSHLKYIYSTRSLHEEASKSPRL